MSEGNPEGTKILPIEGFSPAEVERLRYEAQILKETGISANYFNDMAFYNRVSLKRVLHPEINVLRFEYDTPEEAAKATEDNEKWVREKVAEFLPKVRTYSEYIDYYRNGLPKEIFVTDKEAERIRAIDEKALEMRSLLRDDPGEIDLKRLNQLAFEVSSLIYDESRQEGLRKSFLELDENE